MLFRRTAGAQASPVSVSMRQLIPSGGRFPCTFPSVIITLKLRRNYEKPSERRAREQAEAVRRHRKLMRKRLEREGY
jgi:hypothetical protein